MIYKMGCVDTGAPSKSPSAFIQNRDDSNILNIFNIFCILFV